MENELTEKVKVPYILPMYNSEEKIDEINRLLEILAKRPKCSIVVAMLLVFQKFNFQKLMREFLLNGVKEIIIESPLRVVSYHGVPFTVKNFIRGMRVDYGKHKLFQKEIVDGAEYFYVNIVYTCIYLSDEIAKICKGIKNFKSVHYSLIDEIEYDANLQKKILNEKRKRSEENEFGFIKNNNMSSYRRLRGGNNLYNLNNLIIDLNDSEDSEEIINQNEKKMNSPKNNNISGGNFNNNMENNYNNNMNQTSISAAPMPINFVKNNNIISDVNNNNEVSQPVLSDKLRYKQIKKNTISHYQDDLNSLKHTIQDILNVFDYSDKSKLYVYLKDNLENFPKLEEIFILMQKIGENGQKDMDDLLKLIPSEFFENKYDGVDDKMQENIKIIDELYKEYENKKKNLLHLYQIIQSTVKNVRHSGMNPDENMIKNDLLFIELNEKKFEENAEEMFPLVNKIYNYFIETFGIRDLMGNLQEINNDLSKNEINIRILNNFTQNLCNLFPNGNKTGKNIFDILVREGLSFEEKENQFKCYLINEKNLLLKYIEPLRKYYNV